MYACNKATKVLGMIKRTVRFKNMSCVLSLWSGLMSSTVLVLGIHIIRIKEGVH